MRGRLAPTPSGHLHLGNARTFLATWLAARSQNGSVVLRVEDIDRDRVSLELEREQLADLRWLGLDWDEGPDVGGSFGPYRQSDCLERYRDALADLHRKGAVYPCVCSRKEIQAENQRAGGAPHPGEEQRYPGTCRGLFESAKHALAESGRDAAWRFQVEPGALPFDDLVQGECSTDSADVVGDFMVFRKNGWPAYQLAVVVDDAHMGITQVVRGQDLLASTARQLLLYRALGMQAPSEWAHLPLVNDERGMRMAKRDSALALRTLREARVSPERVTGLLAHSLGLQDSPRAISATELVSAFSWDKIPRTPIAIAEADALGLLE